MLGPVGEETARKRMALLATGFFGMATILSFLVTTRLYVDTLSLWKNPANFAAMFLLFVVSSVPFVLAGSAIVSGISWRPDYVGAVYSCDLIGEAIAACGAPWLLNRLPIDATVVIAGAIRVVSGAVFAAGASRRRVLYAYVAGRGPRPPGGGLRRGPWCWLAFWRARVLALWLLRD